MEFAGVKVGNAHLPNLPLPLKLCQGSGRGLKINAGVLPVNQIQVQTVCVKPLQAFLTGLLYPVVSCVIVSEPILIENSAETAAIILKGHGIVAISSSAVKAGQIAELIEETAMIAWEQKKLRK